MQFVAHAHARAASTLVSPLGASARIETSLDAARRSVSMPADRATTAMKNAWNSGRGKKGTGTKFRKGGENSSQSPFCAPMFFEGAHL
jgi:hypothetical protein